MLALGLALLLLPGLLVVRAPWTVVPALSLAFWVLSFSWQGTHGSRSGFLSGALLASGLLGVLRLLPKHEVAPPPGVVPPPAPSLPTASELRRPPLACWPSAAILVFAAALLGPLLHFRHAPGPELAFQTTATRLLLARDAVPASAEPLLPLTPFSAHPPALSSLAADAAALTGLDPARSVVFVVAAAAAMVVIGAYALAAVWLDPALAAVAAVVSLAIAPGWLTVCGPGPSLLALAFLLPASALLLGHASRSSAAASAMLFSAGLLSQPLLALGVLTGCALVLRRGDARAERIRRAAGTAGLALGLGLPALAGVLSGVSLRELGVLIGGVTLPRALALLVGTACAGAAVALVASSRRWASLTRKRPGRLLAALGAVIAAAGLAASLERWFASGQLPPEVHVILARAAETSGPLDAFCADGAVRDWLPALAGRAAGEPGPWIPAVYADEWRTRRPRPCRPLAGFTFQRISRRVNDIVSRCPGKRRDGLDVLIVRRGDVTLPTR